MAKSVGTIVSNALVEIREPVITEFDTDNILQTRLIGEANNSVRDILSRHQFEWSRKHAILVTTDDVTEGYAAATNASTTVTSVDEDGVDATDFTGITTSMWFRKTGDNTSYAISAVDVTSTPNTLTLTTAYRGVTSAAAGYRCFQDTYSMSTTDLDEVLSITFGEGAPGQELIKVNFESLATAAGGDLHTNTSGRPRAYALISVDSSDYPRLVFWPFPTDDYLLDLWYSIKYSENSTFATNMFSGDAPDIAYDAVEARCKAMACMWDEDQNKTKYWENRYGLAIQELLKRENRDNIDVSMRVATYRRSYRRGYRVRSGIGFDTKSSFQR